MKYEYKVVKSKLDQYLLESELDEFGKEGWELICIAHFTESVDCRTRRDGYLFDRLVYTFKKPINEDPNKD